jgi:16S rRNA processing protein RimM
MQKKENEERDQSGLLNNGKPVFLAVAKIFKPHGLNGEVTVGLLTDFPERLIKGKQVYIGENHIPSQIDTIRKIDKKYLITFVDHNSRDSVGSFRNEIVYIREKGLPVLPDNEYYHHDLIGLRVFSTEDHEIGILIEIIYTGANDVYVIRPHNRDAKEILIPAINPVVKKVDIKNNKMIVKLQEWR